jgi:hypothetical protein
MKSELPSSHKKIFTDPGTRRSAHSAQHRTNEQNEPKLRGIKTEPEFRQSDQLARPWATRAWRDGRAGGLDPSASGGDAERVRRRGRRVVGVVRGRGLVVVVPAAAAGGGAAHGGRRSRMRRGLGREEEVA